MHSINWKVDMREKPIHYVIQDYDKTEKQTEAKDDFHIEQPELKIQSSQASLTMVDNLYSSWQTIGDTDLASALNFVTQPLETLRVKIFLQKSNWSF